MSHTAYAEPDVAAASSVSSRVFGDGRRGRLTAVVVVVLAVVGLVFRLAVAFRPLAVLDRLFVPDDTYYTLSIARSLARGLGPTVGGGAPLTNGFQPLVAFLETPIFWFVDSPDSGLRAALVVLAVCDALTVVCLGRIAYRIGGPPAAVIAAAAWALSPLAVANAAGGLEAALSTMLAVALVRCLDDCPLPPFDGWLGAVRGAGRPRRSRTGSTCCCWSRCSLPASWPVSAPDATFATWWQWRPGLR